VTANVKDNALANNIAGDSVRFTLDSSIGNKCAGALLNGGSSALAITDSNGNASVTYTAGTTVDAVTGCKVTATEANTNQSNFGTEPQTAVPNTITASANPSNIAANGTSSSAISITVTNGGTPVNNDSVTLTASNVPGQNDCGTFSSPVSTNANGQATVVYISTATPGFCTINLSDASNAPNVATSVTIQQHA
jgi:adhesin/invasin